MHDLVVRPTDVKYFLSNAPMTATLPALIRVALTRFTVEQCFEEARDNAGLDEYEVLVGAAVVSPRRHDCLIDGKPCVRRGEVLSTSMPCFGLPCNRPVDRRTRC